MRIGPIAAIAFVAFLPSCWPYYHWLQSNPRVALHFPQNVYQAIGDDKSPAHKVYRELARLMSLAELLKGVSIDWPSSDLDESAWAKHLAELLSSMFLIQSGLEFQHGVVIWCTAVHMLLHIPVLACNLPRLVLPLLKPATPCAAGGDPSLADPSDSPDVADDVDINVCLPTLPQRDSLEYTECLWALLSSMSNDCCCRIAIPASSMLLRT
jgi:hypothetical protein